MIYILVAVIGYLFGSINFAVVIGKLFYKTDVRKIGSNNAGATNVLRTLGKLPAVIVLLGDFSKGILAYYIGLIIGNYFGMGLVPAYICGAMAVVGHNYPVYFGFKGGKGVITTISVFALIAFVPTLIMLGVWLLTVAITRYVSLSSVLAALAATISIFFFASNDYPKIIFIILLSFMLIWKHYPNILRLLNGTEKKIGEKVK